MAAHRQILSPVSTSSSIDDMWYREADGVLLSLQLLEVYEGRPDTQAGLADATASEGGPSAQPCLRSAHV